MARTKTTAEPLTPLELEIMKVLWETGPAAVQAVQEGWPRSATLAYNTVQTMLNVLQRKGKVTRELQGRAFLYAPAVSRAAGLAAGPGRPGTPHVRRLGREPGAQPGRGPAIDAGEARRAFGADRQERGGRSWTGLTGSSSPSCSTPSGRCRPRSPRGLAGDRLLRRSPARLRHALWLAVLAVAIGLPVAGARPRHPAAPSAAARTAAPLAVQTGEAAGWRGALPSDEKRFPARRRRCGRGSLGAPSSPTAWLWAAPGCGRTGSSAALIPWRFRLRSARRWIAAARPSVFRTWRSSAFRISPAPSRWEPGGGGSSSPPASSTAPRPTRRRRPSATSWPTSRAGTAP